MVTVVLPPQVLAFAMRTAERRPRFVANHRPSFDPEADLVGAMPEHAWAWLYHLPQFSIQYENGFGDGGIDFTMREGAVDIKGSQRHPRSWMVKLHSTQADWYVFTHVVLPDTVHFVAKAPRSIVMAVEESHIPGNRIIRWGETPGVSEFHQDDFHPLTR